MLRQAQVLYLRGYVRYQGRIDAELEVGDRILIIFNDGAGVLHALGDGVKPKNWMPSGSEWKWENPNLLVGEHLKREERLEIYIENIYDDNTYEGDLHGRLVKLGSEVEVSDWLGNNPQWLSPTYRTIQREYRTKVGPIDILMAEGEDTIVVVEVKRIRVVGGEVVYQLLRYRDALQSDEEHRDKNIHCVLVAPGLSRSARELLEVHGMDYRKLTYSPEKNAPLEEA
jgi:RecB family endonuclease NucS